MMLSGWSRRSPDPGGDPGPAQSQRPSDREVHGCHSDCERPVWMRFALAGETAQPAPPTPDTKQVRGRHHAAYCHHPCEAPAEAGLALRFRCRDATCVAAVFCRGAERRRAGRRFAVEGCGGMPAASGPSDLWGSTQQHESRKAGKARPYQPTSRRRQFTCCHPHPLPGDLERRRHRRPQEHRSFHS